MKLTFKSPHAEVVSAPFNDLDGYLIWRRAFRAHYRALSAEIRILKNVLSNVYRGANKCTPEQNAFNEVHSGRFVTKGYGYSCFDGQRFLRDYRKEATALCEQRVESKKLAAAMWKPRQQPALA